MDIFISQCGALAGYMSAIGFGGSVVIVSLVGAMVSGFKALSKLGGGK